MEAFKDGSSGAEGAVDEKDFSWMKNLDTDPNTGQVKKTINNIVMILENSAGIKGKIALDEFANRGMVLGPLPWNSEDGKRFWTDVDDAELARYLEIGFGITGLEKIDKALVIVSFKNKFNDVRAISNLKNGTAKRIDTLRNYPAQNKTYIQLMSCEITCGTCWKSDRRFN